MKFKKANIKDMKQYSLIALLLAAIFFVACTSDDNIIGTQPVGTTFSLSVKATKANDADTRALSLDGTTLNATWAMGDAVTVYNQTKGADLAGTLIAQSDGASTTLVGSLTGTIESGDVLKLRFLSPAYSSQDGTLAGIAATCDYAEATVTVSDASASPITTTGNAIFENQQSIVKFTLQDNKITPDPLNATQLTVNAGITTINVTPTSASNIIYVAIPGITSQTVSLSATVGGVNYIYEKTGVTLSNGKYYGFTVSMNKFVAPLTFEARKAGATVTFAPATIAPATDPVSIEYSTDGGSTWTTYSGPVTLANIGDKVYFRGNNAAYGTSDIANCSQFSCSDECYIYGNIMSLISPIGYDTATNLTENYAFANLFSNNSYLYNHPTRKLELPASSLTTGCYESMFSGCTNLTTAPVLSATTLTQSCYENMFSGCTNLTTAPVLPAATLAQSCYESMFSGCTNLTTAPVLSATTLAQSCYESMFSGCTNLTTAPVLSATTLAQSCYESMFSGCTNLTTAPVLSATTLAQSCYESMFYGCTSLATAPALPATTLVSSCYKSMFYGCTSLMVSPTLSAATLTESCYETMFSGCTSLNRVICLATDISAIDCTREWLDGVSATGTFTKAAFMTSWTTGVSGIPSAGWTVVSEFEETSTADRQDYGNKETGTWD